MTGSPTFDFAGARVLVTGGSRGIGRGVAQAFHDAGASVAVTGTRPTASDYDTGLDGFDYNCVDSTDAEAVDDFAASLDRLDVLVNNAGANGMDEASPDGFAESVQLNLLAAHRLMARTEALLAASELDGGASVVNVASMAAFRPAAFVPGYGAAKAGIVQMTKQYALLWAPSGVRVNAVAPGLIGTDMTAPMRAFDEITEAELAKVPMRRWGTPADLVGAFLFLASPAARFITGQTLCIDGGYSVT